MVEREDVSALMDGEVGDEDLGAKLKQVAASEDLAGTWQAYHVIGDVLRGDKPLSGRFAGRVSEVLAGEPTVLAPRTRRSFGANRMMRVALPIAASVAGVAAVAWLAVSMNAGREPGAQQFAAGPGQQDVRVVERDNGQGVVAGYEASNDARVNEYLLVHQEYSPTSAMQGVGSYVRSVSDARR